MNDETQKEEQGSRGMKKSRKRLNIKKLTKKQMIGAVVVFVVIVAGASFFMQKSRKASGAEAKEQRTAVASVQDITSTLSASGSLEAKNSYNITSLVEGEVVEASFEEGDQVTEGQVLYRIDSSSMESQVSSASKNLERAQENYQDALADYQEAQADFSGNTYKSTRTGYIKELHIQAGDRVSGQTVIADIYNDKIMKLKVPFLSTDAVNITAGSPCTVTLTDTGESLTGTVTSVGNMDETITGGRVVRYVHVQVENLGGLTTSHMAVVTIGDLTCSVIFYCENGKGGIQ